MFLKNDGFPVQMQEKRVLEHSVCPIVAAKIEWGNTVKKEKRKKIMMDLLQLMFCR